MDENILWQIDAYHRHYTNAIYEFTQTYWQEPRRAIKIKSEKNGVTFTVKDGTRNYICKLDITSRPPIYTVEAI